MVRDINYYVSAVENDLRFTETIKITKTEYQYLTKRAFRIDNVFILPLEMLDSKESKQTNILKKDTREYINKKEDIYLIISINASSLKIQSHRLSKIEKFIYLLNDFKSKYQPPFTLYEL